MREEEDEGSETCIHNSEALEYGFEIPTLIQNSFMVYGFYSAVCKAHIFGPYTHVGYFAHFGCLYVSMTYEYDDCLDLSRWNAT